MFERLRDPDALLSTLLESLPRQTLIVLDERLKFLARADFFEQAASRQFNEILNAREGVPHPDRILVSLEDIEDAFAEFQVLSHSLLPPDPDRPKAVRVSFATSGFSHMPSDLDAWITLARHRQAEDHQVVILCDNEGQAQRFDEVLREREMAVRILLPAEQDSIEYRPRDATEGYPDILLTLGSLHSGFSSEDLRLTLFTDREVFGRYKRRHSYRRLYKGTPSRALRISSAAIMSFMSKTASGGFSGFAAR
jgi:transcription-repair coupling factor (superfamily II helicase)